VVLLIPVITLQPPFLLSDQIVSAGIWAYLLIFLLLTFTSTFVGGAIPENMILIPIGAAAVNDGLSFGGLLIVTVLGGFAGYEINYWSGRLLGHTTCKAGCPRVLSDENVKKAVALMDKFGPLSLVLGRFLPVLNIPSFMAGVNVMNSNRFIVYNIISAILWCGILLALGFFVGNIPEIEAYLDFITDIFLVIVAAIIIIVILVSVRDYYLAKKSNA
jgi:membrane-associated protein